MMKNSRFPISRLEKLHYNWVESLKAELINSLRLPFSINGMSGRELYVITPIVDNVSSMKQESGFFESVRSLFRENNVNLYIVAESKLNIVSNQYGILCYSATLENEIATFTRYTVDKNSKSFRFGKTENIVFDELPFRLLLNKKNPLIFSKNEAEDLLKLNHIILTTNLLNSH